MLRHILAALGWVALATLTAGAPIRRGDDANSARRGADRDLDLPQALDIWVLDCDWPNSVVIVEEDPCSAKLYQRIQVAVNVYDNPVVDHALDDITQPCTLDSGGLSEYIRWLSDESVTDVILFVPRETAFACVACPSSQANIPANEAENSPDDLSRQMQHIHAGRPSGRDGLSPTVLCSTPSWTPLAMPGKPHMDHGDSSCCCHDQWHIATSKRVPETPINKILSYLATLFEPKESKVPNLHDAFAIADFFDESVALTLMHGCQPCDKLEGGKDRAAHPIYPQSDADQPHEDPTGQGWSYHLSARPKRQGIPLSDNHRPWYMPFPRRPRRYRPHSYPSPKVEDRHVSVTTFPLSARSETKGLIMQC